MLAPERFLGFVSALRDGTGPTSCRQSLSLGPSVQTRVPVACFAALCWACGEVAVVNPANQPPRFPGLLFWGCNRLFWNITALKGFFACVRHRERLPGTQIEASEYTEVAQACRHLAFKALNFSSTTPRDADNNWGADSVCIYIYI